jgi:CheY-like chemotaxis protein
MLKDVIYIDDSPLDLFIFSHFQKKYHCFNSLIATENAIKALADLKINASNYEALPDLIFLDLYMPLFDGYQFLNQFERIYPLFKKEISVHILSSSVSPKDVKKCKTFPHVKDYHVKPIRIDELMCVEVLI